MKKEYYPYIFAIAMFLLVAIFIYPTLYKYDKYNQKYPVKINRITGETKVLDGLQWITVEKEEKEPSTSELETLENSLIAKIALDREQIKEEIINQIRDEIIEGVNEKLATVESEITAYKNYELDPDNSFTIGSTKEEVRNIMGVPDSIDKSEFFKSETWWYKASRVEFISGKVDTWHDSNETLRTK